MRWESDHKNQWRKFFDNWKKIIRNPNVPLSVKAVLFNVLLYRSDKQGWYISERKMAADLGIGKETASQAIDYAIKHNWLLTGESNFERKRRKLRLSGSLRSPSWASFKPNSWASSKPSKYQREYQNNNSFSKKNAIRDGEMAKALSRKESRKKIRELKEQWEEKYGFTKKSSQRI